MATQEEILDYIIFLRNKFHKENEISPYMFYSRGGCYEFAQLLKARFPEGELAITVEFNHVVFYYDKTYYDVRGIFYNTFLIIAHEDKFAPTVWKFIQSFECDKETLRPKEKWLDVFHDFSFDEQIEFEDFCEEYNCTETIRELTHVIA